MVKGAGHDQSASENHTPPITTFCTIRVSAVGPPASALKRNGIRTQQEMLGIHVERPSTARKPHACQVVERECWQNSIKPKHDKLNQPG